MQTEQKRFHIKKGDEVVVISGSQKGKRGKIIEVVSSKQRAIIEGVAIIKRHTRKSQQHPQGAIVEREGTVHVSNLMKAEKFDSRAAKRGVTAEPAKSE